jgi:hypothetical protein
MEISAKKIHAPGRGIPHLAMIKTCLLRGGAVFMMALTVLVFWQVPGIASSFIELSRFKQQGGDALSSF